MLSYNLISLRPHKKSERKDFIEFRSSDVKNLAILYTVLSVIHTMIVAARYVVTRDDAGEVISKMVGNAIELISLPILVQLKSDKQAHVLAVVYLLLMITYTINQKMDISELELDSESYKEQIHPQSFARIFNIFCCFLCPSTPYLFCFYIPIFIFKYIILMHGTGITLVMQFMKIGPQVLIVISGHYLITIRELRRFYDYQKLLKRERALT